MDASQSRPVAGQTQQYLDRLAREAGESVVMLVLGMHWDLAWQKPWWLARHEFQSKMSEIVSLLERNRDLKFSLDGQAILALWWLSDVSHAESRHRYDRLCELVRRGQLEIGPALVILDEFLAPELALLQNLLIGREVTQSFGGRFLDFFDMSDGFGHVAQMAQLMRAFVRYLFISRGLSAADAKHIVFVWESPDGSRVIVVPQQGGYQSGREFGRFDESTSVHAFEDFVEQYGPRYQEAGIAQMLYYPRKDYGGVPEHFEEHLARLKELHPEYRFVVGTNAEYVDLLDQLDLSNLPVRSGDLSGSGDKFVLRGVNAMRMELKLLNDRLYREINSTQSAASLAMLRRGKAYYYPRHDMTRIWSDYLVLLSHDAITGCHSDEVFHDMKAKFHHLIAETNWIKQKALAALAGREATPNHDNRVGRAPTGEFALMNMLPYQRREIAIVHLPKRLRGTRHLRAMLDGRRDVPVQRIGRDRAAFEIETGSFGSASYRLEQNTRADTPNLPEHMDMIENEYLRAEMAANGTLKVTDLVTGRVYSNQLYFESIGDGGDTYTFAPVDDRPYTSLGESASVRHISNGPLVWEMEIHTTLHLPERLDLPTRSRRVDTVAVKVKTMVRLRRGSRQLEFRTTVHNRAFDHRLRVVFPVGEKVESSRALTAFMVNEYPIRPPLDPNWKDYSQEQEPPFNAITNQGLVMVGSLYSANRGITEYEARDTPHGTELCLTLLRCVSHLSQGELSSRRGQAGPSDVAVPEAQCQGEYSFSYTLGLADGLSDLELVRLAQCWRTRFEPTFAGINTTGILDIASSDSVFAGLMPAPDGKGVVAFQWAGPTPATVEFGGVSRVERLELNLNPSGQLDTWLGPHEIGAFGLAK